MSWSTTGFALITSQTAVATPLTTGIWANPRIDGFTGVRGPPPLASATVRIARGLDSEYCVVPGRTSRVVTQTRTSFGTFRNCTYNRDPVSASPAVSIFITPGNIVFRNPLSVLYGKPGWACTVMNKGLSELVPTLRLRKAP